MSDDVRAELERLQKENAELRAKTGKGTFLKVGKSGGVSVYGLGRYPVTLYQEQWLRLLAMADDIKQFIEEHAGELKLKGEK
jgi:hypothetical protein